MSYTRPIVRVQKLHEYIGHKAPIFGLCHDDKGFFYSASGDGIIAKWDSQSLSDAKAIFQANVPFYCVSLLKPEVLACGASNGTIYLYDLKKKSFIKSIIAHSKSLFQILSIDYEYWVSIGGDGVLNVWDSNNFNRLYSYNVSTESLRAIAYDSVRNWLIMAGSDAKIRVFEMQWTNLKISKIKEWDAHIPSVFALTLTKKKPFLISAGRDATIRVWNYENNFALMYEIPAHIQTINHLQLNPNQNYMLSAGMDKLIKLWDVQNEFKLIKVIDKNRNDSHIASVNHLLWLEYNDSVISCSDDKKIIQWAIDINPQKKE